MKIGSLDRTAEFCWCPTSYPPLLALGTAAGAMDASFSATTELEIFELDNAFKKKGSLMANARFNKLSWSAAGMLAGGKENGEVDIYDPGAIIEKRNNETVARHAVFAGPVQGLDFSSVNPSLLAAGGPEGEVLIFDLNSGAKPYRPSSKPSRAEDVTCVSWNQVVDYILAVGSNSGATAVYDLRGKREIMKLAYPGGRRKVTGISWHPSTPTRLVTVNDDDNSPCVLIWDLRNASAPELTLSGHEKGILSVQWCKMDSDLIISTSKDNRTLLWDVSLGSSIGDLCQSRNWTFDAQWCPRNPDMIAVSSFDGTISVHSLQAQGVIPFEFESNLTPDLQKAKPDPNDIFSMIGSKQPHHAVETTSGLILEKPPKWIRRPNGVSWAFGGKLVSFSGRKSTISVPNIDPKIMSRVDMLDSVVSSNDSEQFKNFCDVMSNTESDSFNDRDRETWGFLKVMFEKSREHVHDFLGLINDSKMALQISKIEQKLESVRVSDAKPLKTDSSSFPLYVSGKGEESEADNLITRLCIVGEFDKAVNACIVNDRWADALVIAVSGGPDLLKKTQKAYFNRRKMEKTYIKLLEAVVDSNFEDIVQNVQFDVTKNEWKDLLGFLSTFASSDELSRQFSIFGTRLSEECASPMISDEGKAKKGFFYHAAALSFIGAGDLENAVKLWIRREYEEESALLRKEHAPSRLINHFVALQSLVEKITVLRKAINYLDPSISQSSGEHSLHDLYDRILEYSEILSVLGRPEFAWKNLQLVPEGFISRQSEEDMDPIVTIRDRLYHSLAVSDKTIPTCPFNRTQIISREETAEIESKKGAKLSSSAQSHRQQYHQPGNYSGAGYQPGYHQYPQTQNQTAGFTPYYAAPPQMPPLAGPYNNQYKPAPLAAYAVPEARPDGPGLFTPQPTSAPPVANPPPPVTVTNHRPWVPPAVVKPVTPPVFTPPPLGLHRSSRNASFAEPESGNIGPPPVANGNLPFKAAPPLIMNQMPPQINEGPPINQGFSAMNQRPHPINQGPPIMAGPLVNQGFPIMNQRPPPLNQRPPIMAGPPVNQAFPLMNQKPLINQPGLTARPLMNERSNEEPSIIPGPPMINQRPPVNNQSMQLNQIPLENQGPPIRRDMQVNLTSPATQGPPVNPGVQMNQLPFSNQGPLVSQGLQMNQLPSANQGPPVNQAVQMNQLPPANQGPPVNQALQMNQIPFSNQGPPVNQGLKMNQVPPANQGPPVNSVPSAVSANSSNREQNQFFSHGLESKAPSQALPNQSQSDDAPFENSSIVNGLENQLNLLKRNCDMSQKRILEDAERRLKTLYDQIRSNQLPDDIAAALSDILRGLETFDFGRSSQIQIDLMTRRFDKTGGWIMGIKRLIDSSEKLHKGQQR